MSASIRTTGLTKVYGEKHALDSVDLVVEEGSVFGFLGPNGAGKTTTLHILTGLAHPTSGSAQILGRDVASAGNAVRAQIGFLPDVPGFYEWMKAGEFLRFAGGLFGIARPVLDERVGMLLDLAGLGDVDTKIGGYSRGMKQRLGVAQALINAPRLLLLDEPTSALDPMGRKDVLDMLMSLRGRTTVFFSTHILADVERVCDTVAILDRGRPGAHRRAQGALRAAESRSRGDLWRRRARRRDPASELGGRRLPRAQRCDRGHRDGRGRRATADSGHDRRPTTGTVQDGSRRDGARRSLCRAGRRRAAMSGFAAFAGKEAREILRTWRIWVLPGILLFFALTGPVLAKLTPQLLGALGGDQLKGLVLPTPTYHDAYGQWIKNLSQLALLVLLIVYGSIVSSERKSGTAVLVLTKPVSRTAFIMAKAVVHSAFLAVLVIAGTLVTWGITAAIFGQAPGSALWSASLVWLVFGVLFIALMTLLSVLIGSSAGAAGVGIGAYALVSIAATWKPLGTNSPAALATLPSSLVAGKGVAVLWPVLTSLLLAAALFALAARAFRRSEL
ncbi:MAG: ATP-binding cassette domain-containing protein [Dermatophilaceae bacterium]